MSDMTLSNVRDMTPSYPHRSMRGSRRECVREEEPRDHDAFNMCDMIHIYDMTHLRHDSFIPPSKFAGFKEKLCKAGRATRSNISTATCKYADEPPKTCPWIPCANPLTWHCCTLCVLQCVLQCVSWAQPHASTRHMQLPCHTQYLHAHDFASAAMHYSGLLQMCCSVLRRVAACCSVHIICTHVILRLLLYITQSCWKCVAVCCSVLQCVAMCCRVLQCVAVCTLPARTWFRVLQAVAACGSIWQCVLIRDVVFTATNISYILSVLCCGLLQRVAGCCSVW